MEKRTRSEDRNRPGMKIVAGLGSADEYPCFVQAGADEFFCGYVPYEWNRKYGTRYPLNRREVLCSHVQIGAFSEMEILAKMMQTLGKPVHLTFNSLYYLPEQYAEIASIVRGCMELGFHSYIVADPALILHLRQEKINCDIHLSGETSEVNHRMVEYFGQWGIKRVIFHRKNTIDDMQAVIDTSKMPEMEWEAFALNELCQFNGSFCNSLHCDEMGHLCRVPYRLVPEKQKEPWESRAGLPDEDGYLCGLTGCGLCALYPLREAGITHLKLVGRGNYADFMERDIRTLKRALAILEQSDSEEAYVQEMKREVFPGGCGGACYYMK